MPPIATGLTLHNAESKAVLCNEMVPSWDDGWQWHDPEKWPVLCFLPPVCFMISYLGTLLINFVLAKNLFFRYGSVRNGLWTCTGPRTGGCRPENHKVPFEPFSYCWGWAWRWHHAQFPDPPPLTSWSDRRNHWSCNAASHPPAPLRSPSRLWRLGPGGVRRGRWSLETNNVFSLSVRPAFFGHGQNFLLSDRKKKYTYI